MNPTPKLSRREFLKLAGVTLAASALACSGLGYLAAQTPEIEFIETTIGDQNTMNRKILIAYASRAGSTGEVAQAIGQALGSNGARVDVHQIRDTPGVSGYDAVVIGSAIRMGRWLPEAIDFIKAHRDTLGRVPTAFFTVCMTLHEDTEENRRTVEAYLDPARAILEPVSNGLFAGKIDLDKLSLFDRLIVKVGKVPVGDFRNWDAIRAWAEELKPLLG